ENAYEASESFMNFLRSNGSITSPLDKQNYMDYCSNIVNTTVLTWSSLNKRMQECILSYYIIDKKDELNLKVNETEQLRKVIKMGIFNKIFGKHNIDMKDNRIQNIEGLIWDEEQRIFSINP